MRSFVAVSALLVTASLEARALAAPTVWAIDDGEKIARAATSSLATGAGNPVWSPGQPIRLFALRGETVAFQVVVTADEAPVDGVTVDLAKVASPNATLINDAGATNPGTFVGRRIERFVEHYFPILRRSGSTSPGESLGWEAGSAPSGDFTGLWPDALIPVEIAPSWAPYPLHLDAHTNGAIWIDLTVPATQPPGVYRGSVVVASSAGPLATLPVELEVRDALLPDRALPTMLYYEHDELAARIGDGDAAERHLFQLYRRHHVTPMHAALSVDDLDRQMSAIDGSLYAAASGYEGPGEGEPDGIVVLGTYGDLGPPTPATVATVEAMADRLAAKGVFATSDVFLYAVDESCGSSLGPAWKAALAASNDANARRVLVGWTCSSNPSSQPVDLAMIAAEAFDPNTAAAARASGKVVWIYNGQLPQTGTFFTDADATDPRVNGWIGARWDVGRWFYWETTFWYDGNHGGHGPYDPFATAETFHNSYGDFCEGDGVLVYPGRQVDGFTEHSLGMVGVVASIRLKNLRRGVEDAGYLALARAVDATGADAIADALVPSPLNRATHGAPASWDPRGQAFFDARKKLVDLIAPPPTNPSTSTGASTTGAGGSGGAGGSASNPASGGASFDANEPHRSSGGACSASGAGESGWGAALALALFGATTLARAAARRRLRRPN